MASLAAEIWNYVERHPGSTAQEVRAGLGRSMGGLDGQLATMENSGLLLYEDGEGRLYPWRKDGQAVSDSTQTE